MTLLLIPLGVSVYLDIKKNNYQIIFNLVKCLDILNVVIVKT